MRSHNNCMMDQAKRYEEDNQFFVPDGYNIFFIKQTTLDKIFIPPRCLLYPSDAATIKELVQIFKEEYGIKNQQFGKQNLHFAMDGVGILPEKTQIFQLKSKLHNMRAKGLEFQPFLALAETFMYQCSSVKKIDFTEHQLYKYFQSKENTIQVCVEFPQIDQVFYCQLIASNQLEFEIKKALRERQDKIGRDLSQFSFKVVCKNCGEVAELSNEVWQIFQECFTIEVLFDKFVQSPKRKYLSKVKVEVMEGTSSTVKIFSFQQIVRKKVKTVLEECKIPNAGKLGLWILNTILKPIDFLSKMESQMSLMIQGCIPAFILEESQIFYSIGCLFKRSSFDLEEVTAAFASEQIRTSKQKMLRDIYQRRAIRIGEIPPQHKESSFLDPLLGYTSQIYYRELNQHLRDTDFGCILQQDYSRIQYKFSFAIVRSLMQLPAFSGITYRGVSFKDRFAKEGSVLCFKSFTSTSTDSSKAKLFGKTTFYTIHSLTGRDISDYSYFKNQAEVLFMPYTYFQVTEVVESDGQYSITLKEIPMPRRNSSNLLFWVDDDPLEGSKVCANLFKKYPKISTEVIQLTSNHHLQIWFKKFGHYAKSKVKISLITDLKRGEIYDDGLETIKLMRKYIGAKFDTFIYVFNIDKAKELLVSQGEEISSTLAIGNKRMEIAQFITSKAVDQAELTAEECQLI